jgi:glycosyltransferase involved in cell wall biosynthesis
MKEKMRVCLVGPDLYDQGGIVTVIKSIINSTLSISVDMSCISTTSRKNPLLSFIDGYCKLSRLSKNKQIDLCHINMASKGSYIRKAKIAHLCHHHHIPYIIHLHGGCFREFYASLSEKGKTKCRQVFQAAHTIIFLAPDWLLFAQELGVAGKSVVIPNFVFLPKLTKEKGNNLCRIAFLGRLGKRKGAYVLLEAISLLACDHTIPAFQLILAGDGEIEECRSIVREKDLSSFVEVPGWLDDEAKEALLRKTDILTLPSYFESFGLSLIEAMSYAVPVVATWSGSIPHVVVDGEDGLLVEAGNVKELADALAILLRDPEKRKEMGQVARTHVEQRFSDAVVCEKLFVVYQDILSGKEKSTLGNSINN